MPESSFTLERFEIFRAIPSQSAVGDSPLGVPFGYLESMERMSGEDWPAVRDRMRDSYAVHHSEVEAHISAQLSQVADPTPPGPSAKPRSGPDDIDTRPSTEW